MKSATVTIALALGSAACSQAVGSSLASDVCALMSKEAGGPARYEAIDERVPNLETCAARLEAIRMMDGRPVTGLYNGHFIFVTDADILSAQTLEGSRFRVFELKDRRKIQEGIQVLIDHEVAQKSQSR